MIYCITLILAFQLIGEVITRSLGLPVPGPVLGMVFFLVAMMALPKLATYMAPTAKGLLAHLSLLFVPAGVGIVGHLGRLGDELGVIMFIIFASTVIAILVTVYTFILLSKWVGSDA